MGNSTSNNSDNSKTNSEPDIKPTMEGNKKLDANESDVPLEPEGHAEKPVRLSKQEALKKCEMEYKKVQLCYLDNKRITFWEAGCQEEQIAFMSCFDKYYKGKEGNYVNPSEVDLSFAKMKEHFVQNLNNIYTVFGFGNGKNE